MSVSELGFLDLDRQHETGNDLVDHFHLDSEWTSTGAIKHDLGHRVEIWTRERRPLGSGGFGTAWLEKSQNGKQRVVKEVRKLIPNVKTRYWIRELSAMALLSKNKTNFPEFYGWFQDQEVVFIAMEHFPLGDLHHWLDQPLAEKHAASIIGQVARALELMHRKGITHRDLKPANILVRKGPPDWQVAVADFGVSKRIRGITTALHTSFEGEFMAPEILGFVDDGNADEYTSAVDLWALGCITYWLLTLDMPVPRHLMRVHCFGPWHDAEARLTSNNLDIAATDLIVALLKPLPQQRCSIQEVCNHQWLMSATLVDHDLPSATATDIATKTGYEEGSVGDKHPQIDERTCIVDESQKPEQKSPTSSFHRNREERPDAVASVPSDDNISFNTTSEESLYWLPQHTSDGHLYYYNALTGQSTTTCSSTTLGIENDGVRSPTTPPSGGQSHYHQSNSHAHWNIDHDTAASTPKHDSNGAHYDDPLLQSRRHDLKFQNATDATGTIEKGEIPTSPTPKHSPHRMKVSSVHSGQGSSPVLPVSVPAIHVEDTQQFSPPQPRLLVPQYQPSITRAFRISVDGLSNDVTDFILHREFEPFGSMLETHVVRDKMTGISRGYAFILFADYDAAMEAIRTMDGAYLGNTRVHCNWALSEGGSSPTQDDGRWTQNSVQRSASAREPSSSARLKKRSSIPDTHSSQDLIRSKSVSPIRHKLVEDPGLHPVAVKKKPSSSALLTFTAPAALHSRTSELVEADVAMSQAKYEVAVEVYTRLLHEFPDDAFLLCSRSRAYRYLRLYTSATVDADRLVELYPETPDSWLCLGEARYAAENVLESISAWELGAKCTGPNSHTCNLRLAEAKELVRNIKEGRARAARVEQDQNSMESARAVQRIPSRNQHFEPERKSSFRRLRDALARSDKPKFVY